jgi:Phosphotransferase enzyme family
MAPRNVTKEDLSGAVRAALGASRRLESVERLAGQTRKGAYRLSMDDGSTAVAYLWDDSENFWPPTPYDGDPADPFNPCPGVDAFETAYSRLASLGLRVPRIYLIDRDSRHYLADIAIVEDFPGEDLQALFHRDPAAAAPTLARLREGMAAMRAYRASSPGKVAHIDAGGVSRWPTCEEAALAFGLRCLAEAAGRDRRLASRRDELEELLHERATAVRSRAEYSVVHGELGLDNFLIDSHGYPVIIDVEDLMYFDVEWEHVHMQIRLEDGEWAQTVGVDGLDPDRMALYELTQRLSLVAGPLRLLDSDYPEREFMLGIAEWNLNKAIAQLP